MVYFGLSECSFSFQLITLLDEVKSELRMENAASIQISGLPMVTGEFPLLPCVAFVTLTLQASVAQFFCLNIKFSQEASATR